MTPRLLLAFALTLILGVTSLPAANIVQSKTFDSTDFAFGPVSDGSFNFSPIFTQTLNQFDPTLGTLDSATYTYSLTFDAILQNTTPGGTALSGSGDFFWDNVSISSASNVNGGGGGPGSTVPISLLVAGSHSTADSALTFAMILGTGMSTFEWRPTLSTTLSSAQTMTGVLTTGSFSVDYEYTPVPEPSSVALIAGSTILATLRRRRQQRAS